MPKQKFIQVEYDPTYFGGNYTGVGQFAYLPVAECDQTSVENVFEKQTGISRERIIHYSPDEMYDADGNFLDD